MKVQFEIPGPIVPKQRPRRGRYGGYYTPKETTVFENKVALMATAAGLKKIEGNIRLTLVCETTSSKDSSNVLKSVEDGLKDFFNDRYVVETHISKVVVKKAEERAIVVIEVIE